MTTTTCPGCGLILPTMEGGSTDPRVDASAECRARSHELAIYTLERRDAYFIHQVLVDTYACQHYKEGAPRIGFAFGFLGLCLLLEHGYTGREVQDAHIRLARLRKDWPAFALPENRGALTVSSALAPPPGDERDGAIKAWAAATWDAFPKEEKERVRKLLRDCGEI